MIILTAKIIFRRFFEILFCEALISAVIAALSVCNALTNLGTLITVLFVGVLLFMGIHFMLLRTNCYELPDNFLYFIINLTAYLLFAIFALGVYMLCSPDVYTWLFAVMKFVRYVHEGVSNFSSAVIFLLVGFMMVFVAPCGVVRIFVPDEEDEEEGDVILV